ncbi:hypothetical protein [Candidatus Cyanaurora vandensis]|uniref:hypothetical protein n=1 Tax=Candidatus Cyanaurora vandensis TaxID=2714958 RepID=UPI00257D04A3|nr:hypothetical protein [Candidatus Cyanaurora vandensis]
MIVTGADAPFFGLVQGTIRSIRDKPQGRGVALGFLDLGCTPDQLAWLADWVDVIVQPEWRFPFPQQDQIPSYLKGSYARPHLPEYFPGYQTYLWIDADAWVQDWSAVALLAQGAKLRGLAIVPQIDRGSTLQYGGMFYEWQITYDWYQADFGEQVAQQLWSYPMLNTGAIALHRDAPHWQVWADCLQMGLQRNASHLSEQLALNWAVYKHGLFKQTEMLPAWCNWTCHWGFPRWDPDRACLVEPYLPHTPIGIVHLTATKYERVAVLTLEQQPMEVNLRYGFV